MHDLLAAYPVIIEIPVAWGEMDAFQHVNNIVYFRYFESARIAYLERSGMLEHMQQSGIGPILASAQTTFKFPLTYPDTVAVGIRVTDLGDDRFTMRYRAVSTRHARIAAEGEGVIVSFDYRQNRKTPLPPTLRSQIESLEKSTT